MQRNLKNLTPDSLRYPLQILLLVLSEFNELTKFCVPWNHQKTVRVLVFLGE